jgi:hypothetical protein
VHSQIEISGRTCCELAVGDWATHVVSVIPARMKRYQVRISTRIYSQRNDVAEFRRGIIVQELHARQTTLGPEQITRNVPWAGTAELDALDEFGVIRLGADVSPDCILVGRATPKAEQERTAEELLLNEIFSDQWPLANDTSLRFEGGWRGLVTEVKFFAGPDIDHNGVVHGRSNHDCRLPPYAQITDELGPADQAVVRVVMTETVSPSLVQTPGNWEDSGLVIGQVLDFGASLLAMKAGRQRLLIEVYARSPLASRWSRIDNSDLTLPVTVL